MIEMTIDYMAKIVGGTAHGSASISPDSEFHFDSRSVRHGDVFLALKGEHADGHDYVDNAIANGAAFSIVSKPVKRVCAG